MTLITTPDVSRHMSGPEFNALTMMVERLETKKQRHRVRQHYYDGTNVVKDLGISVPPNLRDVEVALDWPKKAVNSLSNRVKMEGFIVPGADIEDFGIDEIYVENRLAVEAPQINASAMIHSVSFLATLLGDPAFGEPEVIIQSFDAMHATGLWQKSTRSLGAALLILDENELGPTRMVCIFPHKVYSIWRSENIGGWSISSIENTLGRVPVEPVTYQPRLDRPFGQSRITRAVMNITDSAMRTVLRSEVGAEFFSAPQRYILGADEEMFVDENGVMTDAWSLLTGRLLAVPTNEETEENPELGQFPQISMLPHSEQMKMWSQLFASATNLPVGSLGIVQDNPSSAEALYAAKEELLIEAEAAIDGFTPAWVNTMKTAVQLREGLSEVPVELKRLDVRWRDPSTPSKAQATDAVMKLVSGGVLPATSSVTLEQLGFSDTDIQRLESERKREAAPGILETVLNRAPQADPEEAQRQSAILKSKAEALGLLRRAGVSAETAAAQVGLEGLEFIPGEPITIKVPEAS